MVDFSEVKAAQDVRARERGPTPEQVALHLRAQHTVVLRLEELVTSDPWQTYSAHLKTLIEEDRSALTAHQEAILQGGLVGEALEKTVLAMQRIQGRLEARKQDLELPEFVIAHGKETNPV